MLREEPGDSFLRYAVAIEYAAAGNIAEAISGIEALLRDVPDYLGAYYKLGQLHEQSGNVKAALEVYRKGEIIAAQQNNRKTLNEIREAIFLLED